MKGVHIVRRDRWVHSALALVACVCLIIGGALQARADDGLMILYVGRGTSANATEDAVLTRIEAALSDAGQSPKGATGSLHWGNAQEREWLKSSGVVEAQLPLVGIFKLRNNTPVKLLGAFPASGDGATMVAAAFLQRKGVSVAGAAQASSSSSSPAGSEKTMVNPVDGSVLVAIPGGTFTMGSDDGSSNEKPSHRVTLQPYYIGKTPVTNAQYRRFVSATGHQSAGRWDDYASRWGDQAPVVCVSWSDANAYCRWAGLRLPTEAEWEYAARGTDGRAYPWGNPWDPSRCRNSVGGNAGSAVAVGSYPNGASPFGCLDMAGNVLQWCASLYRPYPYSATDGREDVGASGDRVLRGGSWYFYNPSFFRSASRASLAPDDRNNSLGFRVARTR